MSKRDNTLLMLEEALSRILSNAPRRIQLTRKLSARAVETEAGLSNGSAYYYPELIQKIVKLKQETGASVTIRRSISGTDKWKERALEAERLKKQFREENSELKELNAQIAADQYRQMSALRDALQKISELAEENERLRKALIDIRRHKITLI